MSMIKIFLYANPLSKLSTNKICIRLNNQAILFQTTPSINDIFSFLIDHTWNADWIGINIEDLAAKGYVNSFEFITTIRTLIGATVCRDAIGNLTSRNVKIIGVLGHETDPELVKQYKPYVDGLCIRPGSYYSTEVCTDIIKRFLDNNYSTHQTISNLIHPKKSKVADGNKAITLTRRQYQVFKLITERGMSNKSIAKILNISESTVKLHMGSILKKYGCQNRTQLVAFSRNQISSTDVANAA